MLNIILVAIKALPPLPGKPFRRSRQTLAVIDKATGKTVDETERLLQNVHRRYHRGTYTCLLVKINKYHIKV